MLRVNARRVEMIDCATSHPVLAWRLCPSEGAREINDQDSKLWYGSREAPNVICVNRNISEGAVDITG